MSIAVLGSRLAPDREECGEALAFNAIKAV
jgi:hypothetical protein